ncbi:hypothetical protein [Muricoccus pecuniae]|uniref:Uncharacterized protein n=1 Tax=Muricoccus pecuniae TaxID=693023 RepID=A0A840Y3W0_9PROT|nr:hypothetical protein [Roseomonas pecuniae]MBB5694400.1 hypothetical protein [Roseomonas pecuniae]
MGRGLFWDRWNLIVVATPADARGDQVAGLIHPIGREAGASPAAAGGDFSRLFPSS